MIHCLPGFFEAKRGFYIRKPNPPRVLADVDQSAYNMNRLDEPTSGTVLLNGKDYCAIPPRELRRRVGMVMQAAYLFPGTVATNIAFGPR